MTHPLPSTHLRMTQNPARQVRFLDRFDLLLRQNDIRRLRQFAQTRQIGRSDDGRRNEVVRQGPRDGDLGHRVAARGGDGFDGAVDRFEGGAFGLVFEADELGVVAGRFTVG